MKLSHLKELSRKQELIATIRMLCETMPDTGPTQFQISLEGNGEIIYQGPIIGERLAAILRVYGDKDWTSQQRYSSSPNIDYVKTLMNGLVVRIMDAQPSHRDSQALTAEDFERLA